MVSHRYMVNEDVGRQLVYQFVSFTGGWDYCAYTRCSA